MLVLGVDAAKTGWIAVALGDDKDPNAHHLPTIDALQPLATDADAIAIDIPIGIPTGGAREADVLARAFVGARRSSVFLTPVREAIEAQTHTLATRAASARTGTGISQQSYALGTKILEVERWLPSSPCPVYEVHPEVSFAVLLGAPARASKKTWAGMVERRRALEAAGISFDRIDGVAAVRASVDDMLDAAVAAWSAARIAGGELGASQIRLRSTRRANESRSGLSRSREPPARRSRPRHIGAACRSLTSSAGAAHGRVPTGIAGQC